MRRLFGRLSIRSKFIWVQVATIVLMGGFALGALAYLSRCQNEALHQSVCQTLQCMAGDVDSTLKEAAQFTSQMIAQEAIQEPLSALSETENAYVLNLARRNLFARLQALCGQYACFTSMEIDVAPGRNGPEDPGARFAAATRSSPPISEANREQMLDAARARRGGIAWLTFPEDSDGLYLARTIRKIAKLDFSELGVLICRIDFQQITTIAAAADLGAEQIVIRERDGTVLYSNGLTDAAALDASQRLDTDGYDVLRLGRDNWFVTRFSSPDEGRRYYFLLPYQRVVSRVDFALSSLYVILVVGIVLLILLSVPVTHTITDPLRRLGQSMRSYVAAKVGAPAEAEAAIAREEETAMLRRQFDTLAEQIDQLITENYEKQLLIKEARYKALEQQLNPHFLYNTLDAIFWRATAENRGEIAEMTRCLADTLRRTLESSPFVSLRDEVALVDDYLTIQQYRFGRRLSFEKRTDKRWMDFQIPRLCVQPLIENAVNYGLEQCLDICRIMLDVHAEGNVLCVEVLNDGSAFEEDTLGRLTRGEAKPHGFGVGLQSISQRCRMIYGEAFQLELFNRDGFAVARLCFPIDKGGEDAC